MNELGEIRGVSCTNPPSSAPRSSRSPSSPESPSACSTGPTAAAWLYSPPLPPGAVIPEHWHWQADETVYVVDGDFVEGSFVYEPGTFFCGKAGLPHGPHTTRRGC